MPLLERSVAQLHAVLHGSLPPWVERGERAVVVVDLDELIESDRDVTDAPPRLDSSVGVVVVGRTTGVPRPHPLVDVVVGPADSALEAIVATVERAPLAAAALVVALRGSEHRSLDDGLLIESATYSSLQASPEFAAWRGSRPVRQRPSSADPVRVDRHGDVLSIELCRPEVRNALNKEMRDALIEALTIAVVDESIAAVELRGQGESFCSGGDLDEFGSFGSAAEAHLIRLNHSIGRLVAALGPRITVHLHGACVGSGIELAAFAGSVVAAADTVCSLPEVSLGLIPGAGGTFSLPRRIGRHATARLALTGERWGIGDAVSSGLVDRAKLSR